MMTIFLFLKNNALTIECDKIDDSDAAWLKFLKSGKVEFSVNTDNVIYYRIEYKQ